MGSQSGPGPRRSCCCAVAVTACSTSFVLQEEVGRNPYSCASLAYIALYCTANDYSTFLLPNRTDTRVCVCVRKQQEDIHVSEAAAAHSSIKATHLLEEGMHYARDCFFLWQSRLDEERRHSSKKLNNTPLQAKNTSTTRHKKGTQGKQ